MPLAGCGDNLAGQTTDGSSPIDAPGAPPDAALPDAALPDAAPVADAMPLADASADSIACSGQPLPSPEASTVRMSGQTFTFSAGGTTPVPNAQLSAYRITNPALAIASANSRGNGTYTLEAANGGQVLDIYVHVTETQFLDTYQFPATPLYQAEVAEVSTLLLSQAQLGTVAGTVEIVPDPQNSTLVVTAVDCTGQPFAGVTVTTTPPSNVYYLTSGALDPGATHTDASGMAILFNVPPGPVEVDGEREGLSLREHSVGAVAGALVVTTLQP